MVMYPLDASERFEERVGRDSPPWRGAMSTAVDPSSSVGSFSASVVANPPVPPQFDPNTSTQAAEEPPEQSPAFRARLFSFEFRCCRIPTSRHLASFGTHKSPPSRPTVHANQKKSTSIHLFGSIAAPARSPNERQTAMAPRGRRGGDTDAQPVYELGRRGR